MKLLVPLMMPAIHSMRLAASPSRSALIDRDAAGDGAFERDHHVVLARGGEDLVAVQSRAALCWR